ncbi:MAG: hypothetical protein HYZ81_23570 [Nitrospinae bacterium]|nr:hypothetical protein [Nitrospinota bacterium]
MPIITISRGSLTIRVCSTSLTSRPGWTPPSSSVPRRDADGDAPRAASACRNERWFREARVKRIVEGPNEVHRWVVARGLLRGQVSGRD